jgi:hypothetical protein
MHADTTFLGQAATLDELNAPFQVRGRYYVKNSAFKRQSALAAVFAVRRGGALAFDSSSVETAVRLVADECKTDPVSAGRLCRYPDGTPFGGAAPSPRAVSCSCSTYDVAFCM